MPRRSQATHTGETQMPFGDVKDSGYGQIGRSAAVHDFTGLPWITNEVSNQDDPI
ncbi:MAG: hypothetical protein ACRBB0_22215 [Pelagimonas sp.]|uniref:hypothetical protein n=1 Tax=Pelagimonas sp. TaxID=2073170 RepID=UPI003D6C1FF8